MKHESLTSSKALKFVLILEIVNLFVDMTYEKRAASMARTCRCAERTLRLLVSRRVSVSCLVTAFVRLLDSSATEPAGIGSKPALPRSEERRVGKECRSRW